MEYVIFDMDWLDVPIQDYPLENLAICHDPQKRLGEFTWSVVYVENEGSPPKALGLFWDKDEAIRFAKSFNPELLASVKEILEKFDCTSPEIAKWALCDVINKAEGRTDADD